MNDRLDKESQMGPELDGLPEKTGEYYHDDEIQEMFDRANTPLIIDGELGEKLLEAIRSERHKRVSAFAVEALFLVYESEAELTQEDITDKLIRETPGSEIMATNVVETLFSHTSPYLMKSRDDRYETMLTANGIALIEDAFMNGYEEVDSDAVALGQLDKSGFTHSVVDKVNLAKNEKS